jgi:thiosulfate/3-mercaptopyruvate sulfurtransferase
LEAWEKVLLNNEDFFGSIHATLGCIACHGGTGGEEEMEIAHEGVMGDPGSEICADCHGEIAAGHAGSLHNTLDGYMTVLSMRSTEEAMPQLTEAYNNHCAGCHASCGQCHVSRPTSTGGGLLAGHVFRNPPPMNYTCTGCHGSRIENEFKGKNETDEGERYPADVHFNPGGMPCFECHSGAEMHGLQEDFDHQHRYDGPPTPSCTDCHVQVGNGDDNPQHSAIHMDRLSCQVCHSIEYKNCYSCHVQLSDEGDPFFRTEESQMLFYIGRNTTQSEDRPWEYVVVRHVPIDRESFSYYGDDLLPNFNARPTWLYATPHNIQRQTPQNASCNACHGNEAIFLTADNVDPDELDANQEVIVNEIPPPMP